MKRKINKKERTCRPVSHRFCSRNIPRLRTRDIISGSVNTLGWILPWAAVLVIASCFMFSCGMFGETYQMVILLPEELTHIEMELSELTELPCTDSESTGTAGSKPRFILSTYAPGGGITGIPVFDNERSVMITLVKGQSVPVYGELFGSSVGPGGFIPQDVDEGGRLRLSWESGFWASLFLELEVSRLRLEAVNLNRLRGTGWEKSGGNPWNLDRDRLRRALLYNRMNSYQITRSVSTEVNFPPGKWIPFNPFEEAVNSGPAGDMTGEELPENISLPQGIHDFLNRETKEIYRVQVSGNFYDSILRRY